MFSKFRRAKVKAAENETFYSTFIENRFNIVQSDFILQNSETGDVDAIFSTNNQELHNLNLPPWKFDSFELLNSIGSMKSAKTLERSCLISGKTYSWGYYFDCYTKKAVVPYPWNTLTEVSSKLSRFFEEYASQHWKLYHRLAPEVAKKHQVLVNAATLEKNRILLNDSGFTNCAINIDAHLKSHKDKTDISGN